MRMLYYLRNIEDKDYEKKTYNSNKAIQDNALSARAAAYRFLA